MQCSGLQADALIGPGEQLYSWYHRSDCHSAFRQPEFDPKIGQIKDMASVATGISIMVWLFTLLLEIWRIWNIVFP